MSTISLKQWLQTLSLQEQKAFADLQQQLQAVGGDAAALTTAARDRLQQFALEFARVSADESEEEAATASNVRYAESKISPAFMRTAFAAYVRETLMAELCRHGGSFSDAIVYAYTHKWLPEALHEAETCERLYRQHQADIDAANAFRQAVAVAQDLQGNKLVAVGLAWFSYVFRMHELLKQGADPDRLDESN